MLGHDQNVERWISRASRLWSLLVLWGLPIRESDVDVSWLVVTKAEDGNHGPVSVHEGMDTKVCLYRQMSCTRCSVSILWLEKAVHDLWVVK